MGHQGASLYRLDSRILNQMIRVCELNDACSALLLWNDMTAVLPAFKGRRSKRPKMFVVEALLLFCVAPTCVPSSFTNYLQSIQNEPGCSNNNSSMYEE